MLYSCTHTGNGGRQRVKMTSGISDRAFPAAILSVWNSLPKTVRVSASLSVFRSRLKTKLFTRSYTYLAVLTRAWLNVSSRSCDVRHAIVESSPS